ncbi:MAG TPA: type II toxin-antitoxin system ParD family antitoxin [Allosphingosinicella sp.]|nr:type II toxin-antitoxin system ParD family antitoxin [Allosphingosinicella sp.]
MNDQPPRRLARHFEVFIEDQIAQRKYNDSSEVIEDALRLLEEREAKLDGLRRALQEGMDSGDAGSLDIEEILREARAEGTPLARVVEVRLSAKARRDLQDIWRYGCQEWGEAQADAYARTLGKAMEFLGGHLAWA